MIPCIESKCILFPVCKSKETIDCDDLEDYLTSGTRSAKYNSLKEHLPSIIYLKNMDEIGPIAFWIGKF